MSEPLDTAPLRPDGAAPLIPAGLDGVLVLLRHGETEMIVENRFQGQMDTPLTRLGQRQIALAGRRLAHPRGRLPLPIPEVAPLAIVHSPLSRAAESARIAAREMASADRAMPPLRADGGLTEIGQGAWEGLTHDEILARYGDGLRAWRRQPTRSYAPGGESLAQVGERVEACLVPLLAELGRGAPAGTLDRQQVPGYMGAAEEPKRWSLIVAHSGVLKVVLCTLLGLGLDHFWNFDFGLASLTVVELRAGRGVLRALNLDAHLGALEERAAAETAEREESGAL